MVVVPSSFAVITPFTTLAIRLSSLLHIISLFVASSGRTLAESFRLFPFSKVTFSLSSTTSVTFEYTVISILLLTLPSLVFAVIVAVPEVNPIIVPLSTPTIFSLLVSHRISSVASCGVMAICITLLLPFWMVVFSILNLISVMVGGGTSFK